MSVYSRSASRGGAPRAVPLLLALLLVAACRTPEDIAKQSQSNTNSEPGEVVGGCRETWTPISPQLEKKLGFAAPEVLEVILGTHEINLTWATGFEATRLMVGVSKAKAYYVESKSTGDLSTAGFACTNHMGIDATVTLQTRDGNLDEDVEHVRLAAYGHDEARAVFRIKAGDLRGQYVPDLREAECFRELLVRLLLAYDGIHGTLAEMVTNGSCEQPTGSGPQERLAGRWGMRYLNY